MSVIQDRKELRYIRRQNLEEESRIIGNYYRDLIRSYGVDVRYYKISVPYPDEFSTTVNQNTLLLNAYGYDDHPDWSISCNMISYMEVDNDIFNLNKFGAMPTTDVTFYFDSIDYACALAPQLGRLREYKIEPQNFTIEAANAHEVETLKIERLFKSEILSGKVLFDFSFIEEAEVGSPFTMWGEVTEHTPPVILFKANEDIYKSFNYRLTDGDCEDIRIQLTATITRMPTGKYMVNCQTRGAVLFHDLSLVGKYALEITPTAGDTVTIDFPNEESREKFEITSCTDRQLTTDGLNPLLHRYIWKCRAKRLVQAEEGFPEQSVAEDILKEKIEAGMVAMENITEQISVYPDDQDMVYGGYEGPKAMTPTNSATKTSSRDLQPIDIPDDWDEISIFTFPDGCRLASDGFSLFFANSSGRATKLNTIQVQEPPEKAVPVFPLKSMQMLKSSGGRVYMTSIDGTCSLLTGNPEEKPSNPVLSLDALTTPTVFNGKARNPNKEGDMTMKFSVADIRLETYPKPDGDQGLRSMSGKTPVEVFI